MKKIYTNTYDTTIRMSHYIRALAIFGLVLNLPVTAMASSKADTLSYDAIHTYKVDTKETRSEKDTDSDGILDIQDIDDDNDGILDINEGLEFILINNPSFEKPIISKKSYKIFDASQLPFWETTARDNQVELWNTGFNGVPSDKGDQFVELNANEVSSLYQDIKTIPGSVITWKVAHRGRQGTDVATISIGTKGHLSVAKTMSDGKYAWGHYTGKYTVPAGQTITRFSFDSIKASGGDKSIGNFIDSFELSIKKLDSDGDGIPNYLDLDSDNDGIPDNVEAQTTEGYIAPTGNINKNGIDTAYGKTGIMPVDTDKDNITDILDIDSDNDGIKDINETGLALTETDVNHDGIDDGVNASYADSNGDVNIPASDLNNIQNSSTPEVDYREEKGNQLPDYDIAISLNKTTVENKATPIDILVTISELADGQNSGDLILSLTNNINFKIAFDSRLTNLGGYTLKNSDWKLVNETATSYYFKYSANAGKYPSKTRMRIGFKGVFSPPQASRGKFIMNARIKKGSGDSNIKNNKDSDTLIFSNTKRNPT